MSFFLGDIRIRAALQLGLEDISKNDWLLNDILGDTISNPYLAKLYGSQIDSCKQWLANNRINIFLSERKDGVEFPAVTIEILPSHEKMEMRHLGDLSYENNQLSPNEINRPINYVVQPNSGSYSPTSGTFTFSGEVNLSTVVPGQVLVNPTTGTGYIIQSVLNANQLQLLLGLNIPSALYGIIPEYRFYDSRIGHTFLQEEFSIGCHANDQQTTLWLHSVVFYILLRYRQSLLEANGLAESILKSGKLYANPGYSSQGQVIWSRDINLSGQTEPRWIMQPHRILESVAYQGPLKIMSNTTDTFEDPSTVNWATLQAEAYKDEE